MKYVATTILAAAALFTVFQLQAQPRTPNLLSQNELIDLVERAPQTEVIAVVNFVDPIELRDLRSVVEKGGITVISFTVAQDTITSGYVLQKDESLEKAIATYLRDHQLFSQQRFQMQSRMLMIEKDPQVAKALEESSGRINPVSQKEVRVTSIEITGSAQDVLQWQNATRGVNVTQVIDASRFQTKGK